MGHQCGWFRESVKLHPQEFSTSGDGTYCATSQGMLEIKWAVVVPADRTWVQDLHRFNSTAPNPLVQSDTDYFNFR